MPLEAEVIGGCRLNKSSVLAYALWMLQQGYLSIDADGHIWRHAIKTPSGWRQLSIPRRAENISGKGYLRLTLQVDGKLRSIMGHRVIWAWSGAELPPAMQINHKDLNKQHNQQDNLELTDGAGNTKHAYAHGRTKPYALTTLWRGNRLKLTSSQVAEACSMRRQKKLLKEIAACLGISITHAQRITQHAL